MKNILNANEILFRCSSLSHIMTEGRGSGGLTEKQAETLKELQNKSNLTDKQRQYLDDLIAKRDAPPQLGEGVITYLIDIYLREKFGRREEVVSKILDKGHEREEDSITLVSRLLKKNFKKNNCRNKNLFISGEHDLDLKEGDKIIETLDTKTSWSMHTFMRSKFKPLNKDYYWQGQGYMALTGAKKHTVVYCLVNGTFDEIMREKKNLSFRYLNPYEDPDYLQKCKQIEINHIFNREEFEKEYPYFEWHTPGSEWVYDVPLEQRTHCFSFEKNDDEIIALYNKIKECRIWMNNNLIW